MAVSVKPNRVVGARIPPPVEALTDRVKDFVAVCFGEEESEACTVKLNCPVCVVVPETVPADCTVIPDGSVPELSVHV